MCSYLIILIPPALTHTQSVTQCEWLHVCVCVQVIIIKSTQLVQFHCELVNVLWSFRVRVYRPRLQVANVNSLKSETEHS